MTKKKKKPAKLVKRTAAPKKPAVVKDDPLVAKKLAAQAKKLAKQQKILAAADATKTKAKLVKRASKKGLGSLWEPGGTPEVWKPSPLYVYGHHWKQCGKLVWVCTDSIHDSPPGHTAAEKKMHA